MRFSWKSKIYYLRRSPLAYLEILPKNQNPLPIGFLTEGLKSGFIRLRPDRLHTIFPTLTFSSIQRRVHIGRASAPVFPTSSVLKHVSKPEKRLIYGSRLLIYSIY